MTRPSRANTVSIQRPLFSWTRNFALALALACCGAPAMAKLPASHDASAGRHEIVFVESNVAEYRTLLDGVKPGAEVHLLDAARDGLSEMTKILAGKSGIDAIHVLSHGSEGTLNLGALNLNANNLDTRATDLATVGKALKQGGDILLYGCNVAAGADGSAFVSALAQTTRTNIAASTDLTGAAAKGGNWVLEYGAAQPAMVALNFPAYKEVLLNATFDYEPGTGTVSVWGTKTVTQAHTVSGKSLQALSVNDTMDKYTLTTGSPALAGTESLTAASNAVGETSVTFALTSGETFDLTSIIFGEWGATAQTVTLTSSKGSTTCLVPSGSTGTVCPISAAAMRGITSFAVTASTSPYFMGFDNVTLQNIAPPTVTDAKISISGASGTGGAYRIGDTVTATWNNTAAGDNNSGISGVTVDFSQFGGGAAVVASNSAETWTASYAIVAGAIDATNRNVSVTATGSNGSTATTADTTNATVDNIAPTVTDARIGISGASGSGGAFKAGDTVTATWNNTVGGDNNADTISSVTVDFSQFGGGAAVAASNAAGTWTATYAIAAGVTGTSKNVSVTATDNAGNAKTTADTTNATVDTVVPTITFSALSFSPDTGTSSTDFITSTAAQTIGATLSAGLGAGDIVYGSLDNGGSWTDITAKVSGTTLTWNGATLAASNTLKLKVTDSAGNDGTVASQAYVLDQTGPAITFSALSFSADTGVSNTDFITATAAQTIGATLSAGLGAGDIVYGSLDNGSTWTDITAKVAGTTLTWNGVTLAASNTLKLKVTDSAGNDGTVASQAYVLGTVPGAPTIGTATAGNTQGSVTFSAPASNGGSAITSYTATCTSSDGGAAGNNSGAGSPIVVSGLTNGKTYTCAVTATNALGTGSASVASNAFVPKASQTIAFGNPGAQNFGTTPTLSATAAPSGLTVSFTSSTTGVCTITAGGALTFVTTGTCTINADQAGDTTYLAAPTVTQSFSVNAVVPGAPTIGTASPGNGQATVSFSAPGFNGGASITGYTATCTSSDGGALGNASGAGSPLVVSGLTNGKTYTCTVSATNSAGTGSASVASNSLIPAPGPAVVSVAVPGNGSYNVGQNLDFTVTWDQNATVTGTPRITLVIGAATVYANYLSNPTATTSLFRYTVLPGQNDADGITVGALTLNGGTIQSAGGIDATLTLNSVGATASVLVNTNIPGAPTGATATAGNAQATVNFTAPAYAGSSAITTYTATSNPGGLTGSCVGPSACAITVAGLTNGQAYTFTVTATNASGIGAASGASDSVTPFVAGACGTANGTATAFAPSANLCATGTASAVTVGSPWTWSCAGVGGGSTANCSAPNQTTPTTTGTGRAVISGGTWVVDPAQSSGFIATTGDPSGKSPPTLPSGYTFPHGLFDFVLNSGGAGSTATVTITYPTALPAGTVYWKYGRTTANPTAHWYQFSGAVIAGNTVTLTITDGGEGDDDRAANMVIVDPGGPGAPPSSAGNNADLSGLTLSGVSQTSAFPAGVILSPAFAAGTTSYTASVAGSVGALTVKPTAADSTATIKVNGVAVSSGSVSGVLSLNAGVNTITVLVTAQDGTTKTYTVKVTRQATGCASSLSPQAGYHTATAQGGSFNVVAGTGCAWTAASNADWLTVTAGASGTGNGGVSYSVTANAGTASRSATLTAGGQTFTVTQNGSAASAYVNQIQTMYIAYFGRPADPGGLAYYADLMYQRGGNNAAMLDDFWNSAESRGLYTQSALTEQIVQIYEFLFGRPADTSGVGYWSNMVASGRITLPSVAYVVAYNAQAPDAAILTKKRAAAQAFLEHLNATGNALKYQNNVGPARAWLDGVVDDATLAAAIALIAGVVSGL